MVPENENKGEKSNLFGLDKQPKNNWKINGNKIRKKGKIGKKLKNSSNWEEIEKFRIRTKVFPLK